MSAGICVMNRYAVALAADSMGTGFSGKKKDILRNTYNKVFPLSKHIGVILYSDIDFMNVPIELIIKQYQKEKEDAKIKFDYTMEYVNDFISYLKNNISRYHFKKFENKYIENILNYFFNGLDSMLKDFYKEKVTETKEKLNDEQIKKINDKLIARTKSYFEPLEKLDDFNVSSYIEENYIEKIDEALNDYPLLDETQIKTLKSIILDLFNQRFFGNYVGICFAGYGEKELYPSMVHIHLSGMIDNKVRYIIEEQETIGEPRMYSITPLAQTDIMETFLYGVDIDLLGSIRSKISNRLKEDIEELNDSFFTGNNKSNVQKKLLKTNDLVFEEAVDDALYDYFDPLRKTIEVLPIRELAKFSESMINITAFRKKIILDEDVGGPIDVAVISKVDGFVWIKNKNYNNAQKERERL